MRTVSPQVSAGHPLYPRRGGNLRRQPFLPSSGATPTAQRGRARQTQTVNVKRIRTPTQSRGRGTPTARLCAFVAANSRCHLYVFFCGGGVSVQHHQGTVLRSRATDLSVGGPRIFLWWIGTPLSATEKPEKSSATIDGGGAKMAVFLEENGPFWCETGLSFFGVLEREKRLKTQKNRRLAAGLMRFGCKKGVFFCAEITLSRIRTGASTSSVRPSRAG